MPLPEPLGTDSDPDTTTRLLSDVEDPPVAVVLAMVTFVGWIEVAMVVSVEVTVDSSTTVVEPDLVLASNAGSAYTAIAPTKIPMPSAATTAGATARRIDDENVCQL
jgi:hypothetical protein